MSQKLAGPNAQSWPSLPQQTAHQQARHLDRAPVVNRSTSHVQRLRLTALLARAERSRGSSPNLPTSSIAIRAPAVTPAVPFLLRWDLSARDDLPDDVRLTWCTKTLAAMGARSRRRRGSMGLTSVLRSPTLRTGRPQGGARSTVRCGRDVRSHHRRTRRGDRDRGHGSGCGCRRGGRRPFRGPEWAGGNKWAPPDHSVGWTIMVRRRRRPGRNTPAR